MSAALEDAARPLGSFSVLEDGPNVMAALVALCGDVPVGGKQVHDANIAATMLAHGKRRLLTFNTRDFRRFGERLELVDIEGVEGARRRTKHRRSRPSNGSKRR